MVNTSLTANDDWVRNRMAVLNVGADWQPDINDGLRRLRTLRLEAHRGNARWLLAIAGALAIGVSLLTVPSPKVLAHKCLECSMAVLQSLTPSTPARADLKSPSARTVAPTFQLQDADGKIVDLADLKGQVILVNFWATWCEGCQVEIPWFIEFQKQYKSGGLVVVGVSLDADGWKSVRPWLAERKINYPIVLGDDALAKKYGLDAMPLTALVDRNGRIADVHHGLVDRAATQGRIKALLEEHSTNSPD